jgi:hypothetical protein
MSCPALHGPALPHHSPTNCVDCRQCGDDSAPRVAAAVAAATPASACVCCRHYDEHHGRREHSFVAMAAGDAESSGIHLEHDHRVCFFPRRGMSHPGHHRNLYIHTNILYIYIYIYIFIYILYRRIIIEYTCGYIDLFVQSTPRGLGLREHKHWSFRRDGWCITFTETLITTMSPT